MVFTALFFLFHVLYVVFELFTTNVNMSYTIYNIPLSIVVNMFDVIVLLIVLAGGLFLVFNSPSINQVFDFLSFLIFSYLFPLPSGLSSMPLFTYLLQNLFLIFLLMFALSSLGLWVVREGMGGKE
ncbi:MAG: hypothetical protein QXI93_05425 [Candidatus Methanomethylicia archaeon]